MPRPGDLTTGFQRVLTDKELRFVEEYCVDLDAAAAVRRVGAWAEDTASVVGARMLRVPEIATAIDTRLAELSKRAVSSAKYVEERLVEVVERCMQKEPVFERRLNPETGRVENMPTGEWAFNAQGANKALELLGRRHAMFTDEKKITIEHELKGLTNEELDNRIKRLLEERAATDLIQGPDGVFAVAAAAVVNPSLLPEGQQAPVLIDQDPEHNG